MIVDLFIAYFLVNFRNLTLQLHTELAKVSGLLKYDKFASFVLMKANLPNPIILPPKKSRI